MIHDDPSELAYTHGIHRDVRRLKLPYSYVKRLSEMEERELKIIFQAFKNERNRRLEVLETMSHKRKNKTPKAKKNGKAQPDSNF